MVRKPLPFYAESIRQLPYVCALLLCSHFSFSQNPIAAENALAGSPPSEWQITGAGDLTIQGFATDISVNKGQTIRFKIHTTATGYSINIYRLGYYQGNGARFITSLGVFTGTVQPAPLTDTVTGLVDCSNWSETASWVVPANAVSGVYIAKLTRSGNNGSSHIYFVVRDDASSSSLLFKTSDATWQAYNVYGGNSLYVGAAPFPNGHAAKVSYNRPFLTRNGGGGGGVAEDMLFNAEYPMIRFLERNGYDMTYTTDVDMDRDASLITPAVHKVLLSVGHDEYWSAAERAKFENARNAGVHLAFFSGNEIYWKTRWENNHRTLVCYKEGTLGENACGGECDPDTAWTGLWRDGCSAANGTGGCSPENALSGQISWVGTNDTITVPHTYKDLRFWRNTSVSQLGAGQTAILTPGTLGYEWAFEQYPSSYPHGRITMSQTVVNGKTHKLSMYRHTSGALVFGAGSVQWSWGLDSVHDRSNASPSLAMQQVTVNLLADMGVQPATLMAGIMPASASTDFTAPSSVIAAPVANDTVPANTALIITGTSFDAGGGVVAGVEVSVDGGANWQVATGTTNWSYTWTPAVPGTAVIKVRGFDDSGNMAVPGASGAQDSISIVIGGGSLACPCTIFPPTSTPSVPNENDGIAIEVGTRFRALQNGYITGTRFYKGANNTGTHTGHLWSNTGTLLGEAAFINETASGWQQVLFDTPIAITANTTYVVSCFSSNGGYSSTNDYFAAAVTNGPLRALADGQDGPNGVYIYTISPAFPVNSYESSNYWVDVVFETGGASDTTRPTIVSVMPPGGSTNVNVTTTVSAGFSEPVDAATITGSTIFLKNGNNTVAATLSVSSAQVTLTPSSPLGYGVIYTATIKGGAAGVKDIAGNTLATDHTWSFTTVSAPPADYTIFLPSSVPAIAAENDGTPIEVGVKFRASQAGYIKGIRFYKGAANTGTHIGHLWSSSGTKLAEATFVNETASGWQQVLFTTPVAITANTTYVASYFSSSGYYGVTNNYFTTATVNGPLRGLANGEDGSNGLYRYTTVSAFPVYSYQASNYWVDVVFSTSAARIQGVPVPDETFITVRPNPSSSSFRVICGNSDTLVTVRVLDVTGNVRESYQSIAPLRLGGIGERLPAGVYFAEIVQGSRRKTVKLIKTN